MGVSGSGKTTVAAALAGDLGLEMIEGDDHHPAANVEKMRAGIPLTDEDRWPWLHILAGILDDRHTRRIGTVLACSALRRAYRDVLRSAIPADESFVIEPVVHPATLRRRMESRRGHYMPASLLESQLATLEPLQPDEPGMTVDAARPIDAIVATVIAELRGTT
jgi:gluconokinase